MYQTEECIRYKLQQLLDGNELSQSSVDSSRIAELCGNCDDGYQDASNESGFYVDQHSEEVNQYTTPIDPEPKVSVHLSPNDQVLCSDLTKINLLESRKDSTDTPNIEKEASNNRNTIRALEEEVRTLKGREILREKRIEELEDEQMKMQQRATELELKVAKIDSLEKAVGSFSQVTN